MEAYTTLIAPKTGYTFEVLTKDAHRYLRQKGAYRLANDEEITRYSLNTGPIPEHYTNIHFPFWDVDKPADGYGNAAIAFKKFAHKENIVLKGGAYSGQKISILLNIISGGGYHPSPLETYYWQFNDQNRPKIIMFTMYETSKWPPRWIMDIEKYADAVFVPCNWNKEVLLSQGVTKPIHVIPLGYDDEHFKYYERPDQIKTPFNFLHYNAGNERKGYDVVCEAFLEEFGETDDNVRLILKSLPGYYHKNLNKYLGHNKIPTPIYKEMSRNELYEFSKGCHCFVFPSRGEGFGLTPIEMMATGMPTILTDGHAFKDYHKPEHSYGVGWEPIKAVYRTHEWMDQGDWANPSIQDTRKQMRHVFENWKEAKAKGKKAAQFVKNNFTYNSSIKAMRESINKLSEVWQIQV